MSSAKSIQSVEELNAKREWFMDPSRSLRDNRGPFLIVRDNFYPNPLAIREIGLRQRFFQYSPPSEDIVSSEVFAPYRGQNPAWFSSAVLVFKGRPVDNPKVGYRHDPDSLRRVLSQLTQEEIPDELWSNSGDGWNGAFHYMNVNWRSEDAAVHHHYKCGDVFPHGWSGVVYLSPDAPKEAGTSIWIDESTGRCVAEYGKFFDYPSRNENLKIAYNVENVFNRIVLFRNNVLHRTENGFGLGKDDSRFTQTLFFVSEMNKM